MVVVRSPLRITLGGGGTDLPSYYERREGFLISAAIDKYIYVLVNKTFNNKFLIKYSKMEWTDSAEEIHHPIVREAIKLLELEDEHLEICTIADIPAGTGLGSSSSFTVALLKALHTWKGDIVSTRTLAEEACDIEINKLGGQIGKQDQYIASYGGIITMDFRKDGYVWVDPLNIEKETLYDLEDNCMLFYTGYSHTASEILAEQDNKSKGSDKDMLDNLDYVKEMGMQSRRALENGELEEFADIMKTHWEYKKKRSNKMSNPLIDEAYDLAMNSGALGGKLIGAGGGGMLFFYAKDKTSVRASMRKLGMEEIRFKFEMEGAKILL